ncbi:hypothetical protein ACWEV4_14550 [Streptomyces sp. NPDC003860]
MPMTTEEWRACWKRADHAAERLREVMDALGVPEGKRGPVRPLVTNKGTAFVDIGMLRDDVVLKLVEAVRARRPECSQVSAAPGVGEGIRPSE